MNTGHLQAERAEQAQQEDKHTPGPWHIGSIGTLAIQRPAIYGCYGEQVADLSANLLTKGEQLANMRLIAAAPDLLAALNATLNADDPRGTDESRQQAKERAYEMSIAAIAKVYAK